MPELTVKNASKITGLAETEIYHGLYCTISGARQPIICRAGDFFRKKIFQRRASPWCRSIR
jgi:hypothetical protein